MNTTALNNFCPLLLMYQQPLNPSSLSHSNTHGGTYLDFSKNTNWSFIYHSRGHLFLLSNNRIAFNLNKYRHPSFSCPPSVSHLVHLSVGAVAHDFHQLKDSCWVLTERNNFYDREIIQSCKLCKPKIKTVEGNSFGFTYFSPMTLRPQNT